MTLRADTQALRFVLADLSRVSGVSIVFDPSMKALDKPVSVAFERVPFAKALLRLLDGTGIQAVVSSNGSVVLTAAGTDRRRFVTGQTRQSTAEPLEAVHVSLVGTRFETTTDDKGRFTFGDVPPGSYTLRALRLGFAPYERVVQLGGADMDPIAVNMTAAPVPVDAVIVTPGYVGVMQAGMTNVATLTRQQIETVPQIGEDVYRTLGRLPGVATDDFSANFNIRGEPSQSLYVTLDGVPLIEPFHLRDVGNALSIVDLASLGREELMAGGPTADYGDELAGVLKLQTVEPRSDRARTAVGVSSTIVRAMTLGGCANGRGAWRVSGRRGFLDLAFKLAKLQDSISPRYDDIYGKLTYRIPGDGQVGIHALRAGDRMKYLDTDEPSIDSHYLSEYLWVTAEGRATSRLRYNSAVWTDRLDWRRLGYQHGNGVTLDVNDVRSMNVIGGRQDWSVDLGSRTLLKLGAEGTHSATRYDYTRSYQHNRVVNGQLMPISDNGEAHLSPRADEMGVYLSQRVQPVDALTIEAGARYDRASHTGDAFVSPRFNLAWRPTTATTVRAAVGRHSQAQSVFDLQVQNGVNSFQPAERARQAGVGVEQLLRNSFSLRAEVYDRTIDDLRSRYASGDGRVFPISEADYALAFIDATQARERGVELTLERVGSAHVDWSVSYVRSSATQLLNGAWTPRPTDQPHAFHADWSYHPSSNRWRLSLSGQRRSGWPFTPETARIDTVAVQNGTSIYVTQVPGPLYSRRAAAYQRVDLRWTSFLDRPQGRFSFFIDIYNLLNNANERDRFASVSFFQSRVAIGEAARLSLPRIPSLGLNWEF